VSDDFRREFFDHPPPGGKNGCSMSASNKGVWWFHSHAENERCPLRPWEIHWKARR
jgi:hypothetical protein